MTFALFLILISYLLILFFVNRKIPPKAKIIPLNAPPNLQTAYPQTISLTTWNIGYAGLGKDSEFMTDGGKKILPPSKQAVIHNLSAILQTLGPMHSDVFLMQELSDKSPLSYAVPVLDAITHKFPNNLALFRPEISAWGVPKFIKMQHGTLITTKVKPASTDTIILPGEPSPTAGIFCRLYALQVTRFDIQEQKAQWVIINLHLAAFDHKGKVRHKQLEAVFAFAQKEFKLGNYVILGGDWNMELITSNFPNTTAPEFLFWLVNFPKEKLPSGWKIATDPSLPTVRTNYQPYIKGQNFTTIIDGFIVSPNVHIKSVFTTDTKFEHTDHMPVNATFSTNPPS